MPTPAMLYFDKPGKANTPAVLRVVARRARDLGIGHIAVATTSGATAVQMARLVRGTDVKVIAVTYHAGFESGDKVALTPTNRRVLLESGHDVLTCSHALSGVGRSISRKFGGVTHVEIIAHTLRLFGCDGIKVAVEVAVMVADAGMAPTDREILAVGGSGRGADAALVLKAAHMNNFFDLEIREILAKARQRR